MLELINYCETDGKTVTKLGDNSKLDITIFDILQILKDENL